MTKIDLRLWQESFTYISQNSFLFDGTILENITMGGEKKNNELFNKAVKLSHLEKFINELSELENHLIGENGLKLSGGQRQRIALARALYFNRSILILDESLSEVEEKIEREILEGIKSLKSQTIIYITHRKSNLDLCDQVVEI